MNHKKDKGFEPSYWKLSYRRRFIRTLWVTPAVLLLLLLPAEHTIVGIPRNIFIVLGLAGMALQAAVNFYQWKREERSSVDDDGH